MYGGKDCPSLEQVRNCNTQKCKKHCSYKWGKWTVCSKTCGGGVKVRKPLVKVIGKHGGKSCPSEQEKTCNTGDCPTKKCHNIAGAKLCSHVHCKFRTNPLTKEPNMLVHHHHLENSGENHCCSRDDVTKKCECVCYQETAFEATR
jgi:hypothetical protein